jgi:LDH2 family malate/lactate/ureidoglycolate dehydrogenase
MASRVVRFEDNELYDVVQQILSTFQAGERAATAYSALCKVNAAGTPSHKIGRVQAYTMLPKDGPKEVVLLESEKDVALDALRGWNVPAFDYPTKVAAIALIENAESQG